jgi:transposase
LHPKAINSDLFFEIINRIAESLGGRDFPLFFDNLSVHKTNEAKHLFEKLNITFIFNVPYCPQFNSIESYFSQLKATYKKLVLKSVINDAPYDTIGLIKQSIKSVSNENATRWVKNTLA